MTQETWADRFAKIMGRFVPDAITTAILMIFLLFFFSLGLGNSFSTSMEAWYKGLWMLLPFTMQMTLIIVLSSVVGQTNVFRALVRKLSSLPRNTAQVVIVAVLLNGTLSYFYWGLGVALGPIIAVFFAREAERKGIEVDFLFLLSAVWASGALWQFGLSASAPLLMATPGHFLENLIGVIPLRTTIWSPAAILHEVVFLLALMLVGILFMPRRRRPLSHFPEANRLADPLAREEPQTLNFSERLERNSLIGFLLCLAVAAWLYYHFGVKKLGLDINSLNAFFLFLAFLFHRNVQRFTVALQQAVTSSWPVIVIYHLYAGVAGLIQYTTVGEKMAGLIAEVSTPYTFPFFAALSSALVAIFVPSSGGQWAIQGFVTSKAAMSVGVTVQRGMLALSVGDHVGNLVMPFWAMIIAGIARVNFREFIGYGMIFAALWFVIGVIIFTFAPC